MRRRSWFYIWKHWNNELFASLLLHCAWRNSQFVKLRQHGKLTTTWLNSHLLKWKDLQVTETEWMPLIVHAKWHIMKRKAVWWIHCILKIYMWWNIMMKHCYYHICQYSNVNSALWSPIFQFFILICNVMIQCGRNRS